MAYLFLAFVATILLMSWWVPFSQGYEIKTAAKLVCNDFIKRARHPAANFADPSESFVAKARVAGVQLKPDQYSFKVEQDIPGAAWVCKVKVSYPITIEWALIGDVLQELPKYSGRKVIKVEHRVSNTYASLR
jgi:hypothetical protein